MLCAHIMLVCAFVVVVGGRMRMVRTLAGVEVDALDSFAAGEELALYIEPHVSFLCAWSIHGGVVWQRRDRGVCSSSHRLLRRSSSSHNLALHRNAPASCRRILFAQVDDPTHLHIQLHLASLFNPRRTEVR